MINKLGLLFKKGWNVVISFVKRKLTKLVLSIIDNGRRYDVFISEKSTGEQCTVWADKGKKDIIASVEGVAKVFDLYTGFDYSVYIDPRYNSLIVKKAIESAILTK
jgi:hypothetical protein